MLLEHTDSFWHWIPLVALGAALVAAVLFLAVPSARVVWLLMWTMALNLAMGLAGLALHYKGNMEFELEMYPTRGGLELAWEALTGATPALAPGILHPSRPRRCGCLLRASGIGTYANPE